MLLRPRVCGFCKAQIRRSGEYCRYCEKSLVNRGAPTECCFCRLPAAFPPFSDCKRCAEALLRYGPPMTCQRCCNNAGFVLSLHQMDKLGGLRLCFQCRFEAKLARKRAGGDLVGQKPPKRSRISLPTLGRDVFGNIAEFLDGAFLFFVLRHVCSQFRLLLNEKFPRMRVIDLESVTSVVTAHSVEEFLNCPLFDNTNGIRAVFLGNCRVVRSESLSKLVCIPGLQRLCLDGCLFDHQIIQDMLPFCQNLVELRMSNTGRSPMQSWMFSELLSRCKALQILDIDNWQISSTAWIPSAHFEIPGLKAFIASGNLVSDWGVSISRRLLCSELLYLDLSNCPLVTSEGLVHLLNNGVVNLTYLNLRGCPISDLSGLIRLLTEQKSLSVLDLSTTPVGAFLFDSTEFIHEALSELYLHGCNHINRWDNLSYIGVRFPNVKHLDLSSIVGIEDHTISQMCSHVKTLESINLGSLLKLTNASISAILLANENIREILIGGCDYVNPDSIREHLCKSHATLVQHDTSVDSLRRKVLTRSLSDQILGYC